MRRYPNLFIIGAMKAGTSSLADTLSMHKNIYLPSIKEPNYFTKSNHLLGLSLPAYLKSYSKRSEKWLIDASTQYAKAPWLKVDIDYLKHSVGESIKVIYLIRNPYDRFVKHLEHELSNNSLEWSEKALQDFFVAATSISSYEMQLSYWKTALSNEQILIVGFENLIDNFHIELQRILSFLGENDDLCEIDALSSENRAGVRRSAHRSRLRGILHSKLYYALKSYIPAQFRQKMRKRLLPVAPVIKCEKSDWEEILVSDAVTRLNQLVCPTEELVLNTLQELSVMYARRKLSSFPIKN